MTRTEEPPYPTQGDVIYMLERIETAIVALGAAARQESTPQSSVEIEQTAKGPRVTAKVYDADPQSAADEAVHIYLDTVARLSPAEEA